MTARAACSMSARIVGTCWCATVAAEVHNSARLVPSSSGKWAIAKSRCPSKTALKNSSQCYTSAGGMRSRPFRNAS